MLIPSIIIASALGQIGSGSCATSANWPTGPLCLAPCVNEIIGSRSLDCILVDAVQVADPSIWIHTVAVETSPGHFYFALPSAIDSGDYAVTMTLLPESAKCPEVIMGPMICLVQ